MSADDPAAMSTEEPSAAEENREDNAVQPSAAAAKSPAKRKRKREASRTRRVVPAMMQFIQERQKEVQAAETDVEVSSSRHVSLWLVMHWDECIRSHSMVAPLQLSALTAKLIASWQQLSADEKAPYYAKEKAGPLPRATLELCNAPGYFPSSTACVPVQTMVRFGTSSRLLCGLNRWPGGPRGTGQRDRDRSGEGAKAQGCCQGCCQGGTDRPERLRRLVKGRRRWCFCSNH